MSVPKKTGLCRVSIIVLTYNRKRLLKDCLESLLAQDYPRDQLEILVSDDGSSDGTQEMLGPLLALHRHLVYLRQEHKGIAAARNQGIRQATGDIITIVADDYILEPNYVRTCVDFLIQIPEALVVRFKIIAAKKDLASTISHFYYDVSVRRRLQIIDETEAHLAQRYWRRCLARAFSRIAPIEETITTQHALEAAGGAAFQSAVFKRVGLFDETLQRAEDTDMTCRLRELGIPVYYFPFHSIRHQYSPYMLDTFYKCFCTGVNRYRLYQKFKLHNHNESVSLETIVIDKLASLLDALWRARQAESTRKSLFYLPFMFLFEGANKLGFLSGWLGNSSHALASFFHAKHSYKTPATENRRFVTPPQASPSLIKYTAYAIDHQQRRKNLFMRD